MEASQESKRPIRRKEEDGSASGSNGVTKSKVPMWKYRIPKSVRDPDRDPEVLVLRELTADQLTEVSKLARGDSQKSAYEGVKLSIYSVDGHVVNHGDAEADLFWSKWSAKLRSLLLGAWAKMHTTTDEEDAVFFDGREPV